MKTCFQRLQAQQQTGVPIVPADVAAAAPASLEFVDLFEPDSSGKPRWQQLQATRDVPPANNLTKAVGQIKKAINKTGSASKIEEIYQAYPKKVAKVAALEAIAAAISTLHKADPTQDAAAFLLEQTKKFAVSPSGNLGKYTPHPANWFNRGSYADDEQEWGVTENRSGNIKRVIVEVEEEERGETLQELIARTQKKEI